MAERTIDSSASRSLRARLLLFLLGAVALFALAQGVTAYRSALQQVDQMFDYQLQQMALSMRTGFVIGPGLGELDVPQSSDDILIQIWGQDGAQVFRSPRAVLLPMRALLGFSDLSVQGRDFRVYTLQTPQQLIQIAQDRSARTARARALAARAVLPVALFAPLLMLVVWWVISRALAPVERMRTQVAARAAADLSPLPLAGLPSEVRPLVGELNALFGRVAQAFDAQKSFVADAAHELRTPLAALKLQAQALRRLPTPADDTAREIAVARLNQGIDRAIRLVEQLLMLARAQSSGDAAGLASGIEAQQVDLAQVARLAAADLLPQAQGAGITLGLDGAAADTGDACGTRMADAVEVCGDADALRALVANLLDNAIKYTPAPGRVELTLLREGGLAVLRVDDSGPGVAANERERVFDRFFRSHDATASGSGLGLAIVKAIADRHGARIALSESPLLGGLRVELRMPLATAAAQPAG